jgi:hypothetical protein
MPLDLQQRIFSLQNYTKEQENSSFDRSTITMSSSSRSINGMNIQQACPLFLLSQELRDEIYETALASNAAPSTDDEPIEITRALSLAPSNGLGATCYRLWLETAVIYAKSHRAYWSLNRFLISMAYNPSNSDNGSNTSLRALGLGFKYFQHINRVTIEVKGLDVTHAFHFGPSANLFTAITLVSHKLHWNEAPHLRLEPIMEEMMALGESIMGVVKGKPQAAALRVGRAGQYVAATKKHLGYVARGRELNINEKGLMEKCEAAIEEFGAKAEVESVLLKMAVLEGVVKDFGLRHKVEIRQVLGVV